MGSRRRERRRVLRIGVLQDGRIVEDRTIFPGETVTFGGHHQNMLVVKGAGVPARMTLIVWRDGCYRIAVPRLEDVKVVAAGGRLDRERLAGRVVRTTSSRRTWRGFRRLFHRGKPAGAGMETWLLLEPDMRGTVVFPGATVLFQFIPEPTRTRSGFGLVSLRAWLSQRDPVFAAVFVLSVLLHTTVMGYAFSQPPPTKLEQVIDRFPARFVPWRARETDREATPTPRPAVREEGEEKASSSRRSTRAHLSSPPRAEASSEGESGLENDRITRIGVLGALTRFKQQRHGVLVADVPPVGEGVDLGSLLDRGVEGMATASIEVAGLRGPGVGTGLIGSADLESVARESDIRAETRLARKIPSVSLEVRGSKHEVVGEDVFGVVRRRLPAVTACYEQALKTDPNLSGKLYLTLSVEENGRVSHVDLSGPASNHPRLKRCIARRVVRWPFPPQREPVEITIPIVLAVSS